MADLEVLVLGCGDALGSGGRLHTCFSLKTETTRLLLDCGSTAMIAMRRRDVDPEEVDAIALSHLHGDHFSGLVFLLIEARHVSKRKRPLVIAGPPGVEARVKGTMELLFPDSSELPYPFDLTWVELHAGAATKLGEATVTPHEVVHPSGAPSYGLRAELAGKVVAFSGDTEWTETLVELARDADLFLCECAHYTPVPNFHLDYQVLMRRRRDFTCRRLLLTHLGQRMIERMHELELECAVDGMRVLL